MIRSFRCSHTESLARGERVRSIDGVAIVARRKLRQLEIATRLDDLRVPPGNRLEAFGSMINGESASAGPAMAPRMWKSLITIEGNRS